MSQKIILCRCEDVSLKDVLASIEAGYDDIEEIKRYTGFGTGPCQGKECSSLIARVLAEHSEQPCEAIAPFTSRPPLVPSPLRLFATDDEDAEQT